MIIIIIKRMIMMTVNLEEKLIVYAVYYYYYYYYFHYYHFLYDFQYYDIVLKSFRWLLYSNSLWITIILSPLFFLLHLFFFFSLGKWYSNSNHTEVLLNFLFEFFLFIIIPTICTIINSKKKVVIWKYYILWMVMMTIFLLNYKHNLKQRRLFKMTNRI